MTPLPFPGKRTYIGVKMVGAEPMKAGHAMGDEDLYHQRICAHPTDDGYKVTYPDGSASWCPKEQFEAAYYPISGPGHTITNGDVHGFACDERILTSKIGEKTAVAQVPCITGFEFTETSACVDPANYNQEIGVGLALDKIKGQIWSHLGFVLQWAKYGLNHTRR